MALDDASNSVRWKIHVSASPEDVFALLTTDEGRAKFWAESAVERNGLIHFVFPNGFKWKGRILQQEPPNLFALEYIGNTETRFALSSGRGGTDLTLSDQGIAPEYRDVVNAGWVSVLMNLKAVAEFGVDLRNHDPTRTWDQGYADN